ncbi:MAG: hypothetical protein ACYC9M_14350 [Desulfobulbaceae bacterium]
MKQTCMNCKFYKVEDALSGYCRAETKKTSGKDGQQPMVRHDHVCAMWVDCGQNYYIRLGWVKAQEKKKTPDVRQ